MPDLLIYWRDYRRNRAAADRGARGDDRSWHTGSRLATRLQPGDRLWLATAGAQLGLVPRTAGFLVEVWTVLDVVANPGDQPDYPAGRYARRIVARLDAALSPRAPAPVDDIIRPAGSSPAAPIGQLLQGPRTLTEAAIGRLQAATARSSPEAGPLRQTVDRFSLELAALESAPIESAPLDPDRIALGIRQPWGELILRGIKTIEVRSLETNVRGPIYLYASRTIAAIPAAQQMAARHALPVAELPTGVLIGSVEIVDCRRCTSDDAAGACVPASLLQDRFAWSLANPRRLADPQRPRFLPYGVWFYPFRRRTTAASPVPPETT